MSLDIFFSSSFLCVLGARINATAAIPGAPAPCRHACFVFLFWILYLVNVGLPPQLAVGFLFGFFYLFSYLVNVG
jgi:hypothetical protein